MPLDNKCPHCGGGYLPPNFKINLEKNFVDIGGEIVRIRPRHAELLDILYRFYPKPLHRDELFSRLYGWGNHPETGVGIIKIYVYQIRKLIRPYGVNIKVHHGNGYALEME